MVDQIIKDFCRNGSIPLAAAKKKGPFFDERKGRVTKGDLVAHKKWNLGGFIPEHVHEEPFSKQDPTFWLMYIRTAHFYVVDIDIKGSQTAKDVLTQDGWDFLSLESKYLVETGSGGLHAYFKLPADAEVTTQAKVKPDWFKTWVRDGCEAELDILCDQTIVVGSSYSFKGKAIKHTTLQGRITDTAESAFMWALVSPIISYDAPKPAKAKGNKAAKAAKATDADNEHAKCIKLTTTHDAEITADVKAEVAKVLKCESVSIDWHEDGVKITCCDSFKTCLKTGIGHTTGGSKFVLFVRSTGCTASCLSPKCASKEDTFDRGAAAAIQKILHQHRLVINYSDAYEELKAEIERTHFFVEEPEPLYVRERAEQHDVLLYQSIQMQQIFANRFIGETDVTFFLRWKADAAKRTYKRMESWPDKAKCPKDAYNTYVDPIITFQPRAGVPTDDDIALVHHQMMVMCGHDEATYEYLMSWMAQIVQQPAVLSGVAIIFVGEQGVGKDVFWQWFGEHILGQHLYLHVDNTKETLFGKFNSIREGKLLLYIEEAGKECFHENADDLKRQITSKDMRYEGKGREARTGRNYGRMVLTTNNSDALKIEPSERRIFAIRCGSDHRQDRAYFSKLVAVLEKPKVKHVFYDVLVARDISAWDPIARPITQAYRDMKQASTPNVLLWLSDDATPFQTSSQRESASSEWLGYYIAWAHEHNVKLPNPKSFGTEMRDLIDKIIGITKRTLHGRSTYAVDRDQVLAYMMREGYLEAEAS